MQKRQHCGIHALSLKAEICLYRKTIHANHLKGHYARVFQRDKRGILPKHLTYRKVILKWPVRCIAAAILATWTRYCLFLHRTSSYSEHQNSWSCSTARSGSGIKLRFRWRPYTKCHVVQTRWQRNKHNNNNAKQNISCNGRQRGFRWIQVHGGQWLGGSRRETDWR